MCAVILRRQVPHLMPELCPLTFGITFLSCSRDSPDAPSFVYSATVGERIEHLAFGMTYHPAQ